MPENKFVPRDDIDLDGWDLFRAAEENRVDITYALLVRGYDANVKNEDGRTPEELALRKHSLDVAKFLITFRSNGWYLARLDDQEYA